MKSGIYKINNIINNNFYIGSAKNLKNRREKHISDLKSNRHINKHLQNAWNKHGESSFVFEEIDYCDIDKLIIKEQYYIDTLNPQYNICRTAGSKLGFKCSEETKLKISQSNKGRIIKQESRDKTSKSLKGRKNKPHSKETKNKISLRHKGKCHNSKEELMVRTIKSLEKTRKKIDLIDNSGNILQTFISLKEAEDILKISYKRISMCITGKRKHTGNMKFQYHKIDE